MKPTKKIYVGARHGRFTILELLPDKAPDGSWQALCKCDCGTEKIVKTKYLGQRKCGSQSCGCLTREKNTKHGAAIGGTSRNYTREYNAWRSMRQRCIDKNHHNYDRYGGRGIKVCERWQAFENFYADMGPKPSPRHTVDRIDCDGDYEPSNCRWATPKEQARNTRRNVFLTVDGISRTAGEWADVLGISAQTIRSRIFNGWSHYDAVKKPVAVRRSHIGDGTRASI